MASRIHDMPEPVRAQRRQAQLFGGIWMAVLLQLVGQAIDLRWHATHSHFETATDQLQAHWLVWIGSLATVVLASIAARATGPSGREGLVFTVAAGLGYVAVSIWHFLEHAAGADPALPHILLVVTKVAGLAGVIWATVQWRAARRLAGP